MIRLETRACTQATGAGCSNRAIGQHQCIGSGPSLWPLRPSDSYPQHTLRPNAAAIDSQTLCLKAAGHSGRIVRKSQNGDLVVILLTLVLRSCPRCVTRSWATATPPASRYLHASLPGRSIHANYASN